MISDNELDPLFAVEPENFIATRDALAKRMRAEKRRDEAAEIALLRRPPVTVWAMNQVARAHGEVVTQLLLAGEEAVASQSALLRGGTIEAFTAAVERRRSIVTALVQESLSLLVTRGAPEQYAMQLRSAFEIASIHPAVAALLRRGRLTSLPTPTDETTEGPTEPPGPTTASTDRQRRAEPAGRSHLQLVPDLPPTEQADPPTLAGELAPQKTSADSAPAPAPHNATDTAPHNATETAAGAAISAGLPDVPDEPDGPDSPSASTTKSAALARIAMLRSEWESVLDGARGAVNDVNRALEERRADHDALLAERVAVERSQALAVAQRLELVQLLADLDTRLHELHQQSTDLGNRIPDAETAIAAATAKCSDASDQLTVAENALAELARAEAIVQPVD